jgi:membrane-bound lytic murein transglycosylase D
MLTRLRGLQVLLLWVGLMPVAAAGVPERLPVPDALEPAVAFWQRIYTDIPVDEGVIHDIRGRMLIVDRVTVPRPPHWQARREAVAQALARNREALRALAAQAMQPDGPDQAALLARLPATMDAAEVRALAERLRFQGGLRERFREGLERSGRWRDHITAVLAEYGVPRALAALPHVESSFDPRARSHAGAAGLWQFTAGTGRRFLRIDPLVDERLDPWKSTRAAARLLARNHAALDDWPLAITAYNHGLNGIRRAVREVDGTGYMAVRKSYDGPRFGFSSRHFYPALIAAARVDRNAGAHFPGVRRDERLGTIRVQLPHYTPLDTLVDGLPVNRATIVALNPGLGPSIRDGRQFVPRGHGIVLPARPGVDWSSAVAGLPGDRLYRDQRAHRTHRVAAGQTVSGIAQRYDVDLQRLMAANAIEDARALRAGQILDLPVTGATPEPVGKMRYRVERGDTLGGIAVRYDVGTDELIRLNELDDPHRIRVGQQLVISRSAAVAAVDITRQP